ncbi:hypothetical protein CR513_46595, partial [Mucuna pruriens]
MNKSRKKGDVIFKLDLEKAYAKTSRMSNFTKIIISLIIHDISVTSISLLWNDNKTQSFYPQRRLR